MNNINLDLKEILKDAPIGTKLYSPLLGECKLYRIDDSVQPIIVKVDNELHYFTKYGQYLSTFPNSECLLFPSKDNRDWSAFKVPQKYKHFEPLQKVLVAYFCPDLMWKVDLYSHYSSEEDHPHICLSGYSFDDDHIIPYEGNEDKLGKPVNKNK